MNDKQEPLIQAATKPGMDEVAKRRALIEQIGCSLRQLAHLFSLDVDYQSTHYHELEKEYLPNFRELTLEYLSQCHARLTELVKYSCDEDKKKADKSVQVILKSLSVYLASDEIYAHKHPIDNLLKQYQNGSSDERVHILKDIKRWISAFSYLDTPQLPVEPRAIAMSRYAHFQPHSEFKATPSQVEQNTKYFAIDYV